jgi:hypothetical protein
MTWPALCRCLRPQLLLCALTFPLFPVFPSQAQTPHEGWAHEIEQGRDYYVLTNRSGDAVVIACGDDKDLNEYPPRMGFRIGGKPPPAASTIWVQKTGKPVAELYLDSDGIFSVYCRVCVDHFLALWTQFLTSKALDFRLSDGRTARFSMQNVKRVLPPAPCPTP